MVKLRVVPGDFQQAGSRGGHGARLPQQEPTAVQDASAHPDEQAESQGRKSQELPSCFTAGRRVLMDQEGRGLAKAWFTSFDPSLPSQWAPSALP